MHYEILASLLLISIVGYLVFKQTTPLTGRLDALARRNQFCNVLETIPYTISGKEVVFEIMDESCESGMPHTINPTTIRFPKSLWKQKDSERFKQVLRHEMIHLLQRRFPTAWRVHYKRWGYTIQKDAPAGIPGSIVERVRYNPDIADAPWAIFEDRYVTVACYKSVTNPQLRETEIVIWDLELGKRVESMPESWPWRQSSPPTQQGEKVSGLHQAEHPHELSAEMGANLSNQVYVPEGFREFLKEQFRYNK
jgi:hypothetical protein